MPRGLIRELRGRIVASEGLCVGPCDNHAPVRPRPVAVPSSVETRAFLCLCAGAPGPKGSRFSGVVATPAGAAHARIEAAGANLFNPPAFTARTDEPSAGKTLKDILDD